MPVESVAALVDTLRQGRLLRPAQLEELTQQLQQTFTEPRALARALLERGWLTPYQINQLFQGKARELLLGSYILLERLGEGAVGQVFKARHQHMKRVVGLVVVREDLLTRPGAVEDFYNTLQAVSQLSHPNLVAAYDAGQIGRTHYFAMEHIEGIDLERHVQQSGPMDVALACEYLRQTARGLQHAYERGLRHHALSPADILVVQYLSRRDPGAQERAGETQTNLDSSGGAIIKVRNLGLTFHKLAASNGAAAARFSSEADFLAPERSSAADEADIRADLYSLGAIGYYLLTGKVPFPGGSVEDKRQRRQQEDPAPVESLRPEVPADVAAIIRRLMARDPEERYQSPAEAATDLATVLGFGPATTQLDAPPGENGQPAPAPPPAPPPPLETLADLAAAPPPKRSRRLSRRWLLLNLTGGLLLLGLVAGVLFLLNRQPPADVAGPPPEPTPEDRAAQVLTDLQARAADPTADRDALRDDLLAYQQTQAGSRQALHAAGLLRDLPGPLDQLNAQRIPPSQRVAGQPRGLVAVLGDHRQRNWTPITSVAYHGKLLASGGTDGVIRLWDDATWCERAVLRDHSGRINYLEFAPDGRTLASASADRTVRLWDVSLPAPRERAVLKDFKGEVNALAFSPDGMQLATASSDRLVRLWDLGDTPPRVQAVLNNHTDNVWTVAFAPDGQTLATGSSDKTVRLWDLRRDEPLESAVLRDHTALVRSVAFSPDGRTLASGSHDRTIRIWDLDGDEPRERSVFRDNVGSIYELAFLPGGQVLASVSQNDANVRLWDLTPPENPRAMALLGHPAAVWGARISADGRTLVSGGQDGVLRVWDLTTSKPVEHNLPGPQGVPALAFAPNGKILVSGNLNERDVRLWDLTRDKPHERLLRRAHPSPVRALAFAADGKTLACGGASDPTIRLWKLGSPEAREVGVLGGHDGGVHALTFTPDGKQLASAGEDKLVRLWTLAKPQPRERATVLAHNNRVLDVAFAPDGRTLASASADGILKRWDLGRNRQLPDLHRDSREYWSVMFAPEGSLLAAASVGPVQLWDLISQKEKLLQGHAGQVAAVAFSPDGQRLVSADLDGRLIFWDRRSGAKLDSWQLPGAVYHLAFASDSRHLATANGNGTIYIIRLAAPTRQ